MKLRPNIIFVNVLLITLALGLATAVYLGQVQQEVHELVQSEQQQALKMMRHLLRTKGADFAVDDGQLLVGDYHLNGSSEVPDQIQDVFGGIASIFLGDERIATSIRDAEGNRVVGSRLQGAARAAVIDRQGSFEGETLIDGKTYLTSYEPIFDQDGVWIGAIAVGVQKERFVAALGKLRRDVIAGAVGIEAIFVLLSTLTLRQHRRHERQIQESEEKYRTLFENSSEGIFLIAGTYLDCNEQAAALFGCRREEILGKTPADFSPVYQPDGNPSVEVDSDLLKAVFESPTPCFFPWLHRKKDGTLINTEVSLKPVKIGGRQVVQAIVRDVTDRLKTEKLLSDSEKKYRQLFSQMLNAVVLYEVVYEGGEPTDYRFLDVNLGFEQSTGKKKDDLLGRTQREVFPLFEDHWLRAFSRVAKSGEPAHLEYFSRTSGRWLEASCYVPAPGQLAVVFADITPRKTAESRLNEVLHLLSGLKEDSFFEDLVVGFAGMLGSDCVLIGEMVTGEEGLIRTRAVFAAGRPGENFEFQLPVPSDCSEPHFDAPGCIPYETFSHLFPEQETSYDKWKESLCCIPLKQSDGRVVGLMAGLNRPGSIDKKSFEALMQLFSLRATEELQRQQRESRLRAMSTQIRLITDSVPVAIAYTDSRLRYRFINRRYETLFGIDGARVVGEQVAEVLGPGFSNTLESRVERVLSGQEKTYLSEFPQGDGGHVSLLSTYIPHRDETGTVLGFFIQHYDTSELALAQKALQDSEQRYRTLFETTGTATMLIDKEGKIVLANGEFERLTQRTKSELKGVWYVDLFDTESRERIRGYHDARLRDPDSAPSSYECTLVRKDGSHCYLQVYVSMIPGTDQRIASYHDITPLKTLEDSLHSQLSFKEALLNTIPSPIFYKDRQGRYLGCNEAFEEYLGRRREEIVGRTAYDLAPKELADIYFAKDEELFSRGGIQTYEATVRHGDGCNHKVVFFKATFNNPAGDVGGLIGVILDVTELKHSQDALRESEERFHELFSQNQDAILIFRADGSAIVDANPAATELLGYEREELLTLSPQALTVPEEYEAMLRRLQEGDEHCVFHFDKVPGLRRDGSAFAASIRGKIILLKRERVIYCSVRDISEKLQLEENVRNTQAKLIHANKMTSLGMLTSSVAHEINNPNSYISVNAATLTEIWEDALPLLRRFQAENGDFQLGGLPFSELEQLAPRLFRAISEGSGRIAAIVSNMKNFVRETPQRQRSEFSINNSVRQAMTILWHHIHKHTDSFQTHLDEPLPSLPGDGQQLEQVVINLIMNALQALPSRDRSVTVETRFDAVSRNVSLLIRDEGRGMDPEVLSRLTEPFFTTRIEEGGTGLGLYISSSIIKDHGGEITFTSAPGRGTTVQVRLPLHPADG